MTSRCAEHDARIRQLVAEGMSKRNIAGEIGHGITDNMVIGYCHRRGIKPGQPAPPSVQPEPPSAPVRIRGTPTNPQPWYNNMLPYGNIGPAPRTCRFISGEPNGAATNYCGKAVEQGSYCHAHHVRCHERRKARPKVELQLVGD